MASIMASRRGMIGDRCSWCIGTEQRRRHRVDKQLKDVGVLKDSLLKICELHNVTYRSSASSNWVCNKCYDLIRSLISAENQLKKCHEKIIEAKVTTTEPLMKRSRPQFESPSSQPTQPAKRSSGTSNSMPSQSYSSSVSLPITVPKTRKKLFLDDDLPNHDTEILGSCDMPLAMASCAKIHPSICSHNANEGNNKEKVTVKMEICYPSKVLSKEVKPEYQSLCKAIMRGSDKSIAEAVYNSPAQPHIINRVKKDIEKECKFLCRRNESNKSPFHRQNIHQFSLSNTLRYLINSCPLLYELLCQCVKLDKTDKPLASHVIDRPQDKRHMSAIIMAVSVLINGRNPMMNGLQSIIAIVLHAGHAHKMVYSRLNHLALSISYTSLLSLLDHIGKDNDLLLTKWQQELTDIIRVHCESGSNMCEYLQSHSPSVGTQPTICSADSIPSTQSAIPLIQGYSNDHTYASVPAIISQENQPLTVQNNKPLKLSQLCIKALNMKMFRIIGDNIDFYLRVRDVRLDNQNKSIHWFHLYAVLDRVSCYHLEDTPCKSLLSVPNESFLLASQELSDIRKSMGILVSRVLVKHMTVFDRMSSVATWHIPHEHSKEMKEKSILVWLGVLFKNEQIGEDSIDICKFVHKFVPGCTFCGLPGCVCPTHLQKVAFGGDQLTMERMRSAIDAMCDSHNESQRLEGLVLTAEDWHAKQCFLQVIWHMLYNENSACDCGTLYYLRNVLNRRNVKKDPKDDVNGAEDFLEVVIDALIIHAVTIEFQSEDGVTLPQSLIDFISLIGSNKEKQEYLMKISLSIVDKYMLPLSPNCTLSTADHKQKEDFVYNYGRNLLTLGMMHRYFRDSIREGDGNRVVLAWKMFLPLFKQDGRHKYAREAFILLAQDMAILSPRMAHQLRWGRFVNTRGGVGKNLSCDHHMEHMNKFLKQALSSISSTFKQEGAHSVERIANAISQTENIVTTFDENFGVHTQSGSHSSRSNRSDLEVILAKLHSKGVFRYEDRGRQYQSSKCNCPNTLFHNFNMIKFNNWISQLKKSFHN